MGINPIKKIRKLVDRSFLSRRLRERFLSQRNFALGTDIYQYVIHPHNYTWTNERAVEIAIARHWVDTHQHDRTLEVGNVTQNYFPINHDVVDKYEVATGVINVDIVDFDPAEKYQNIFAISTLEHVGWDRDKKEPDKIVQAVTKLKSLLAPGGELMATMPIGFNTFLDEFIDDDTLQFDRYQFLRRINSQNEWEETTWQEVKGTQYNSPFPNANAIVVASFQNKT